MADLLIGDGAEQDYSASLLWYASRSRAAAEGFEAEFSRALEAIYANPDGYPFCDAQHHYYLLKRYPFQVIYRRLSEQQLLIVAVAHSSRRPGFWATR